MHRTENAKQPDRRIMSRKPIPFMILFVMILSSPAFAETPVGKFFAHCYECHDESAHQGNLDLTALKFEPADAENFAQWVKIHDRITAGEMPPKDQPRPPADEAAAAVKSLREALVAAERERIGAEVRTGVRRMTRAEYENTIRD